MSTKSSKQSQAARDAALLAEQRYSAEAFETRRFWDETFARAQESYGRLQSGSASSPALPTPEAVVSYCAQIANNAVIHRRNVGQLTQTVVSGL